jgi:hypothetical protein
MTTALETYRRTITEASWQQCVIEIALRHGWRLHCVPDALYRRSFAVSHYGASQGHKGWPDLVLCKSGRLIVAELKSQTGRVRPEQQVWLDDLAACGVEVKIWRPSDYDEIVATLTEEVL